MEKTSKLQITAIILILIGFVFFIPKVLFHRDI